MRVNDSQLQTKIASRDVGQIEQLVNKADQNLDVATNKSQARTIQFRRGLNIRDVRQVVFHFQHVQHRRNGAKRSSQFVRKCGEKFVFRLDCHLQGGQVRPRSILHFRAGADIADIALNDVPAIDQVNVTDELDLDLFSTLRDQWEVFIANILVFLQLLKSVFVGCDVFELAELPEHESDDFPKGVIQEVEQKRVHIDDLARLA